MGPRSGRQGPEELDDLLDRKVAALRAHRSQTRSLEALGGTSAYRHWWDVERFVEGGRSLPVV
jgi:LmbE family N-acetylglucosaminyl deacetylase